MNKINLKSADKSFRLDSMVFNLGLSESRAKATDLIKEGKVLVNSKTISKPSYLVKVNDKILIEENSQQWVSRGAIKLLFAIALKLLTALIFSFSNLSLYEESNFFDNSKS